MTEGSKKSWLKREVGSEWLLLFFLLSTLAVEASNITRAFFYPDKMRVSSDEYVEYTEQSSQLTKEYLQTLSAIGEQQQLKHELSRQEIASGKENQQRAEQLEKTLSKLRAKRDRLTAELEDLKADHEEQLAALRKKAVRRYRWIGILLSVFIVVTTARLLARPFAKVEA